jgi:hypothetical protein
MTRIKKTLWGALVFITLMVFLLQIDDDLSPESNALLDVIDWQTPSNAYIYLLGINTPLDANPLEAGAEILAEIRLSETIYKDIQSYDDLPSTIERERFEVPQNDVFCGAREPDCIASLFVDSKVSLSSPAMKALKQRYLTFIEMRDYRTLTEPNFLEPFAAYDYVVKGNRVVSLSAIEKASAGNVDAAIDELYQLIELEKLHIAETDNLIGRMIAYFLLNETVDVLSVLVRRHAVDAKKIELLSPEQLSMTKPVQREFAYVKSALTKINLEENYSIWPDWMLRMVFKPNMTINAAVPNYENAILMSELPIAEFSAQSNMVELKNSWIRNIVGTIVNKVASADLAPYIARGYDMNAKLALFNETLTYQNISSQDALEIANPYYPLSNHAVISEDRKQICFDGPYEDPRSFRCLKILDPLSEVEKK